MSALDLKRRIQTNQTGQRQQAHITLMEELTGKPIPPTAQPMLNGLSVAPDGTLSFGETLLTRIGLVFPASRDLQRAEADQLLAMLLALDGALAWMIGDLLAHGESRWGITYEKIAAETGRDKKTLYNYAYVANSVHISLRSEILDWSHHFVVAAMSFDEQRKWLSLAAEGEGGRRWSVTRLRHEIAGAPSKTPTALIDRTLSFADKAEREASKLPPVDRQRIADELEAAARRIRALK